jgi:uncharacterized OB-fold protein
LSWTPVSGRGEIYSFTITTRSSFATDGPLVVALVALEEGPVMMSNILTTTPETVRIGDAVVVTYEAVSDTVTLPMFQRPDDATEPAL